MNVRCEHVAFSAFGVPWLGHGRATEFLVFAGTALYVALWLVIPDAQAQSQATNDVFYREYVGTVLALLIALAGTLTGVGLLFNVIELRFSRLLRIAGASLGAALWVWFGTKYYLAHATATWGFILCVLFEWASIRIIILARANLPRPGAPGAMGQEWIR